MRSIRIFIVTTTLLLSSIISFSQRAIPPLEGKRVHDEADVLSSQTIQQLELQLKQFEDSTSNQIAILIIPSLDGDILEDYALRVAHGDSKTNEGWKLGQADKDNGVLLLIAIDDHKMRIEVGYGLEGVLPDAICNQIIRNEMAPNFRRGDYDAGVLLAINGIVRAIGGEYVSDGNSSSNRGRKSPGNSLFTLVIILGIIVLISRLRGGGRSGGSGWSSGAGWFIGGLGGGGSSGGGGGFGGFSGGGGGFGGGGSSGSW